MKHNQNINTQGHQYMHDLRNVIGSILSLSDLYSREVKRKVVGLSVNYPDLIRSQCQQARKLMDCFCEEQQNDEVRLPSPATKLELRPHDLVAYLAEKIVLFRATAAQHCLRFSSVLPDRALIVNMDSVQFDRILLNLFSNAVKFTPEGGSINLELSTERRNNQVCLRMSDTGIGISPAMLRYLFLQFTVASRPGLRNEPSQGLGLYTLRQLVSQHGGTISVASQLNQGTSFEIQLPALQRQN
ncbi:sensor histidine kinase [Tunicatimonas pelagia]|uniref:sensor histidine kinase n=1 Tax=Tunicatimonas pelagia TaxID=931531 RepID=UPI002665E8E7|nr:sensor histidine kinase [Tunicatimonas pelagia]WKN42764.1 sensor histidine kinase [Tunicatimonas pelagia]